MPLTSLGKIVMIAYDENIASTHKGISYHLKPMQEVKPLSAEVHGHILCQR